MFIFSSPLLDYTGMWIRQFKYIVTKTKEQSNKIVNLMTPEFLCWAWTYGENEMFLLFLYTMGHG